MAKWYFEEIGANIGAGGNDTIHQIDFDQFQTAEEVVEAWSRANDISKQMEADKRSSLPIGMPDGSNMFIDTGENEIVTSWQIFDASTMGYNPGVTRDWHSHTLVTVDQREGEYHICFMHDPDTRRSGGSPTNFIEDLASTMYRRALALHEGNQEPKLPAVTSFSIRGLLSSAMKSASKFAGKDDKPRPEQFSFYIHVRPEYTMRESFCRVDMDFDGQGFSNPKFNQFDVIPEIIQNAYYETAMPTIKPGDVLRLDATE